MFNIKCSADDGWNATGNVNSSVWSNYTLDESSMYAMENVSGNYSEYPMFSYKPSVMHEIEVLLYTRVMIVICSIGVVGNLLNLLVLTRRSFQKSMGQMEKSSHLGLIALALSDLMFCVTCLPFALGDIFKDFLTSPTLTFQIVYGTYKNGIINTFIASSTFLTVSMAVIRYIGICHPLKARMFVSTKLTVLVIIAVYAFSVVFNLPRYWFKLIGCYVHEGQTNYFIGKGFMEMDRQSYYIYMCSHFVICIVLPFTTLTYCTVFLTRALRESTRLRAECAGREHADSGTRNLVTLTLIIIVVCNILLVCPAEILNFCGDIVVRKEWITDTYNFVVAIANTLQVINFSLNFALYCAINSSFRKTLVDMFYCGKKRDFSNRPPSTYTTSLHKKEAVTLLDRSRSKKISMTFMPLQSSPTDV